MKRLWDRKWLVVVGAMTIFLSIGAVAWAAQVDEGSFQGGAEATAALCAAEGEGQAGEGHAGPGLRKEVKERRDQWLKRQKALMEVLRDDMTLEDKAAYDALVAEAKEKREALQEAREDLADTLKQLRDLVNKYLDSGSDSGSS